MPLAPVKPGHVPGVRHVGLTGCRTKSEFAGHFPGGAASPCAPGGSAEVQIPVVHCGTVIPPIVIVAWPLVQNDRSPCFSASMATTVKPCAVNVSAMASMSRRPRPSPWRKTTRGEHFSALSGAGNAQLKEAAARLAMLGVATITGMGSAVAEAGFELKAPVVSSSRRKVAIPVSRIWLMLAFGTKAGSTPYFVNASVAVETPRGPGTEAVFAGVLYGSAPS